MLMMLIIVILNIIIITITIIVIIFVILIMIMIKMISRIRRRAGRAQSIRTNKESRLGPLLLHQLLHRRLNHYYYHEDRIVISNGLICL